MVCPITYGDHNQYVNKCSNVQNVLCRHSLSNRVVNHFLVHRVPFLLDTLAQLFHVRDPLVVVHTLL